MGSTDKAVITGFICRLCSKMNRFVIHIFGEEGDRLGLARKINAYLPITIAPNDPLPKTVCLSCIERLEAHHQLMEQFAWARKHLAQVSATRERNKKKFARARARRRSLRVAAAAAAATGASSSSTSTQQE